jgi:hypothetical protein
VLVDGATVQVSVGTVQVSVGTVQVVGATMPVDGARVRVSLTGRCISSCFKFISKVGCCIL